MVIVQIMGFFNILFVFSKQKVFKCDFNGMMRILNYTYKYL